MAGRVDQAGRLLWAQDGHERLQYSMRMAPLLLLLSMRPCSSWWADMALARSVNSTNAVLPLGVDLMRSCLHGNRPTGRRLSARTPVTGRGTHGSRSACLPA
jgi:hypothetical protein